jgi:peptidoglycan/xylan/chitin deacetylase (PgdA/CDA1 family)
MTALPERRRVVLIFHGIGEPSRWATADERRYWCSRQQWPGIIDALADARREGAGVEITFDDGNTSDVEDGLPALLERALTATFNVCAGRIGQPGYLDDRAIAHLHGAGMSIGSHGWNHVDLRTLPERELLRETEGSRQRIAEAAGAPVASFAVPFGSYDRRVLGHLRTYTTVYTSDCTAAAKGAWIVPRWSYVQGWTPGSVRRLLAGGESLRHRWRQSGAMVVKRWR